MPEEQHGCLQGKGIHTALIPNLAFIEANLSNNANVENYRYVGGLICPRPLTTWPGNTALLPGKEWVSLKILAPQLPMLGDNKDDG